MLVEAYGEYILISKTINKVVQKINDWHKTPENGNHKKVRKQGLNFFF